MVDRRAGVHRIPDLHPDGEGYQTPRVVHLDFRELVCVYMINKERASEREGDASLKKTGEDACVSAVKTECLLDSKLMERAIQR